MSLDSHFKETFDRVVVINLARRPERLARFTQLFEAWPFKTPQRFEAFDGSQLLVPDHWDKGPGAYGCSLSHQAVVTSAIADKVSSLFVLEDDAYPVPNFTDQAADFLNKVPGDWDCLMFGAGHLRPPVPITDGVVQCKGANRAHAYAVRGKMMPTLLDFWKRFNSDHCDIVLSSLMGHFKVYAPDPLLIGQDAGFSDINGRVGRLRFLSTRQIETIAKIDSRYAIDGLVHSKNPSSLSTERNAA
jgi:hypothetical protein